MRILSHFSKITLLRDFQHFSSSNLRFCFTTRALIADRSSVTPYLREKWSGFMFWGINFPEHPLNFCKLPNIPLFSVKIRCFLSLDTSKIFPSHFFEYFLVSSHILVIGISMMGLLFVSSWLVLFLSWRLSSYISCAKMMKWIRVLK